MLGKGRNAWWAAPAAELHARAAERQDLAQALQLVPEQAVGVLNLLLAVRVLRRRQRRADRREYCRAPLRQDMQR